MFLLIGNLIYMVRFLLYVRVTTYQQLKQEEIKDAT
jgi:hypothetical protein